MQKSDHPIHPVDRVPKAGRLTILSIQHVLAFYAGAVVVPLVVAGGLKLDAHTTMHLINADLFTCGIATLIQSVGLWKIGVRLPIIQGVTTTALSPMIAIGLAVTGPEGGVEGLPMIYGAIIVSGIFTFLAAPFFARVIRFFPPVVIGTVLATMGITLLGVSAGDIINRVDEADPPSAIQSGDIALAALTLAVIIIVQRFFKGFLGTISVLLGLVIGTAVAFACGRASFAEVPHAAAFGFTTPFYFGWPQFSLTACLSMIIVMIITMVETTGDVFAAGEIVNKRITRDHIAAALRADGLSTALGGVLNSFPYTCFAQNIGLVRLTRVKSRWVVAFTGVLMIVLGLLPKAGAIVASIPSPVLGAASLALFANVALVGFQTLGRVDLSDARNAAILTTSLGLAMLVSFKPDIAGVFPSWAQIFFASGVTVGSITAIVLNLLFFHVGPRRGENIALSPTGRRVSLEEVNAMDKDTFVSTFASLYNGASWPLERAWERRPFSDVGNLKEILQDAALSASTSDQDALLANYPDITDMLVATEAEAREMSQDVGSFALGDIEGDQREQLLALSADYRKKFDMPFVVCLERISSVDEIIEAGLHRLENAPALERIVAISEVGEVVSDRFDIMLADANPVRTAWGRKFEQLN
ncbi:MAG: solute carrier family 23 protein [Actinomycetaceae bacterium]|nr:solute carrier family 23 protein [Actinomycetaceae bacterium]